MNQKAAGRVSAHPVRNSVEALEAALLPLPQVNCPLVHRFAPGVYLREITMPEGALIVGHKHKTEHFNVILQGSALVLMDGEAVEVKAPDVFVSRAGVRKVLYVRETMIWQTIHVTESTDLAELEAQIVDKSATFKAFEDDVKRLKALVDVQ